MKQNTSKLLGFLFIAPLFAYGFGDYFLQTDEGLGAALIILNSILVILIGIVFLPYLKKHNFKLALGYLITRITEAILLLIALKFENYFHITYQLAMLILGIGSVLLFQYFLKNRLLSKILSIWAIVGYAMLAFGSLLEIAGIAYGMELSIIGGLFELTFGVFLLFFGHPFSDNRSPEKINVS